MRDRYRGVTLSVEDRHWWYRGRRAIIRSLLEQANLPRPSSVLDAGCGGGGNLEELARLGRVVGIEPAGESLEAARARGVGEVVEGVIEELPFADASFDVVVTLDVIEHVDDDIGALAELRRVTKPGGHLFVTVPAYQRLYGPHDVANDHRRRYEAPRLREAGLAAGWTPTLVSYFNTLALPVAAAHRAVQKRRLGSGAPPVSDFERTPPWLDGVLALPMKAEARWLGRGWSIPAGLSVCALFSDPA